jgi:hypothetical protein
MESYFYLAVRIAVAAYILYKVWNLLFRDRLFGLWDRIPIREKRPAPPKEAKPVGARSKGAVLGRTNIVLLDDPRRASPEPVATTDLEPASYIGQDKPIPTEDINSPEPPEVPSDDELYEDAPPPDENEMSSGVAFEDLSDAAEVLMNGITDETQRVKAAKTLYDIQNTEIMEMLVREVCSVDAIEGLFKECLDGDGFPINKRNSLEGFDMEKYV